MWIITRNENFFLQRDGSWRYRTLSDTTQQFDSHQSAVDWIEQESLPKEYVSIDSYKHAMIENHRRVEKEAKKSKAKKLRAKYVQLVSPIAFYKSVDADDDCWPVFAQFTATHAVMCDGYVQGVFGTTSDEQHPFYCYTGEDYDWAFENCYSRQQPAASTHDFRTEGF